MSDTQRLTEIVESDHHDHDCPGCGDHLDSEELEHDSLAGGFYVPVSCSEYEFEGVQSYYYERTERFEQVSEEFLCILDTQQPSDRDLANSHGEIVNGLIVIREVLDESQTCERCDAEYAYVLEDYPYGPALCREHLQKQPMTAAVVEDEDAVKQFDLPEAPRKQVGA